MQIERLSNIDEIIELQKEYYKIHGIYPLNVSNWTVSTIFKKEMEQYFEHSASTSPIDYLYSYSIASDIKDNVMKKLGVKTSSLSKKSCIFFPNNSLSIANICNFLQKMNIQNVCILYPAYFSIESCLDTYKIKFIPICVARKNHTYHIPWDEIMKFNIGAIWITSPIYSTGALYTLDDIHYIETLLENDIFVISDESFCIENHELIRYFPKYKNFISIYSPHKAICFNSYKFSAIICDDSYEDFFEQWLDVFCGNLPQTTIASIYHYLSDNYSICYTAFQHFIKKALIDVRKILKNFPNIETDNEIYGNLMTLYIKNLDYDISKDLDFLKSVIKNTHVAYYPGYLNGFSKNMGFCFRINLTLYSTDFLASLQRLLLYLSKFVITHPDV